MNLRNNKLCTALAYYDPNIARTWLLWSCTRHRATTNRMTYDKLQEYCSPKSNSSLVEFLLRLFQRLNQIIFQTCPCKNGLRSYNQTKYKEVEVVLASKPKPHNIALSGFTIFRDAKILPKRV